MKSSIILKVTVAGFALAILPAKVTFTTQSVHVERMEAIAKNGNGGQGNGGQGNSGQGNGGQGNSGQGNSGQGNSGQGNASNSSSSVGKNANSQGKTTGQERATFAKEWASKFGPLNAFRASPRAFEKANPSSRVGKIAAYKEAATALNDLGPDLEGTISASTATLAGYLDLDVEDIEAFVETYKEYDVTAIQKAIDDKTIALSDEAITAEEIVAVLASISTAKAELEGLKETVDQTYSAAGGKNATPDVMAELNKQLDIAEYQSLNK